MRMNGSFINVYANSSVYPSVIASQTFAFLHGSVFAEYIDNVTIDCYATKDCSGAVVYAEYNTTKIELTCHQQLGWIRLFFFGQILFFCVCVHISFSQCVCCVVLWVCALYLFVKNFKVLFQF